MLYQISSYACKLITIELYCRKSNKINLLQFGNCMHSGSNISLNSFSKSNDLQRPRRAKQNSFFCFYWTFFLSVFLQRPVAGFFLTTPHFWFQHSAECLDSHQPWGSPQGRGQDGLAHWPTCGLAAPHTDSGFGVGDSASSFSASWMGGDDEGTIRDLPNWCPRSTGDVQNMSKYTMRSRTLVNKFMWQDAVEHE